MKVSVAIPCLNRGGTEMQTLYLVRALKDAGHDVGVVCYFESDPQVVGEYRSASCDVLLMGLTRGMSSLDFIRALRRVFAEDRPDVAHVQYMTPGALAIVAAKLAAVPRIFATVHQPYSSWHSPAWKLLLRCSALLCTHFISVSLNAEKSWFGSGYVVTGCERRRLPSHFTIHNAVDTESVARLVRSPAALELKKRYGGRDRFVFGYAGRLSPEKGPDILVEAFSLLAEKHRNIFLLVLGEGPEKAALSSRFGDAGWWDRVTFAGRMSWEETMTHLAVMDVVIVPSRYEGFGLTAVEAMAASKPVIAARAGGLTEIITHGQDGLLFEVGSAVGLSLSMEAFLLDPDLRNGISLNAPGRASDFDTKHFDLKIRNLYNVEE